MNLIIKTAQNHFKLFWDSQDPMLLLTLGEISDKCRQRENPSEMRATLLVAWLDKFQCSIKRLFLPPGADCQCHDSKHFPYHRIIIDQ